MIKEKAVSVAEAERQELKKFNAWRKRVKKKLPDLANRVFALRGRHYMGCGFHWSMEKTLGRVILDINNFDKRFDMPDQVVCRVIVAGLFEEVVKAEKSADKLD